MNLRKAALFAFGSLLSVAIAATPAHAELFDWSVFGPSPVLGGLSDTGSGTLTANLVSGKWVISGITGTIDGSAITGLISFDGTDNLLFPDTTYLDTDGLGIETASGVKIDIFSFNAPNSTDINPTGNNYGEIATDASFGVGTFSLTAVPEPATFALLGSGLLGLGGIIRRRF